MGRTKEKLRGGEVALGGWIMIGHPAVAELLAGEGFDWICVDLEHTCCDYSTFRDIALALKGTGCDLLARLQGCDPVQAKRVLDIGADGIIVPGVNCREEAELAVGMAKYPPEGFRGASLSRATDYGRNFEAYWAAHNESVLVAVMLEHARAVENADEILSTRGIDAAFIGPYDLSASMNLAGQLDHPQVQEAQRKILASCRRHGVPPGLHVVLPDAAQLQRSLQEGYRFVACSVDTQFIIHSCRAMLKRGDGQ